jgi:hypothetical protein
MFYLGSCYFLIMQGDTNITKIYVDSTKHIGGLQAENPWSMLFEVYYFILWVAFICSRARGDFLWN